MRLKVAVINAWDATNYWEISDWIGIVVNNYRCKDGPDEYDPRSALSMHNVESGRETAYQ